MPNKPTWLREWEQAVLKSRALIQGPGTLTTGALEFMEDALADALVELERIFTRVAPGESLRADRALALFKQITRVLDGKQQAINTNLDGTISRIIQGVAGAHELGAIKAMEAVGINVGFDFSRVPQRVLEVMAIRRGLGISETWRSLNARAFGQTYLGVDRFLATQVALGTSAERVRRRLAYMMATDAQGNVNEGLMRALRTRGVTGRRFEKLLRRAGADPSFLGFDSKAQAIDQLTAARGLLFNTRRIAVSEINTAYTEAQRVSSVESPVVKDLKWTLSSRHATIPSSPDICDTLASRNLYGLGPGHYPPEVCPAPPHPYCGCSRRPRTRPIEEWDQPKPEPRKPRSVSWEDVRRDYGRKRDGSWVLSEERARKLAARFNEQTGTAYRVWRDGESAIPDPAKRKTTQTTVSGKKKKPAKPIPDPDPTPLNINPIRAPKVMEGNPLVGPDGDWLPADQALEAIKNAGATVVARVNEIEDLTKQARDQIKEIKRNWDNLTVRKQIRFREEFPRIPREAIYDVSPDGILRPRPDTEVLAEKWLLDNDATYKKVTEDLASAKAEFLRISEQVVRLTNDKKEAIQASKQASRPFREFIKFEQPAQINFEYGIHFKLSRGSKKFTPEDQRMVEGALGEWAEIVGRGTGVDGKTVRIHEYFRARASAQGDWISTSNPDPDATIVHELGHWLEEKDKEYFEKIRNYILARTQKKKKKKLSDLTGMGYSASEKAFDMRDVSMVNPYTWKIYEVRFRGQGLLLASEITSMVLENWYENMLLFASQDEDLFKFIYNLMREGK